MYPGDAGAPGSDMSGTITTPHGRFAMGDHVFGYAEGCLGTAAPASHLTLAPAPASISPEAASTTTTVFLTVDAALSAAAGLPSGSSVLVHAASGGVGSAALQVAAAWGITVVATAGNASKRTIVRSSGASCVCNSRDTSFAHDVMLRVRSGVHSVLNSLTGVFV